MRCSALILSILIMGSLGLYGPLAYSITAELHFSGKTSLLGEVKTRKGPLEVPARKGLDFLRFGKFRCVDEHGGDVLIDNLSPGNGVDLVSLIQEPFIGLKHESLTTTAKVVHLKLKLQIDEAYLPTRSKTPVLDTVLKEGSIATLAVLEWGSGKRTWEPQILQVPMRELTLVPNLDGRDELGTETTVLSAGGKRYSIIVIGTLSGFPLIGFTKDLRDFFEGSAPNFSIYAANPLLVGETNDFETLQRADQRTIPSYLRATLERVRIISDPKLKRKHLHAGLHQIRKQIKTTFPAFKNPDPNMLENLAASACGFFLTAWIAK